MFSVIDQHLIEIFFQPVIQSGGLLDAVVDVFPGVGAVRPFFAPLGFVVFLESFPSDEQEFLDTLFEDHFLRGRVQVDEFLETFKVVHEPPEHGEQFGDGVQIFVVGLFVQLVDVNFPSLENMEDGGEVIDNFVGCRFP